MPAEAVFVIEPFAWERAFKSWTGAPVGAWMRLKTEEVRGMSKVLAPPVRLRNTTGIYWGHGTLQGMITTLLRYSDGGDLEGHVVAMPKHALLLHEGTKPHVIHPKKAKMLRFRTRKGTVAYAKMVKHPGTIPNPFLSDALQKVF